MNALQKVFVFQAVLSASRTLARAFVGIQPMARLLGCFILGFTTIARAAQHEVEGKIEVRGYSMF
jgi:hypothetical protein